MRRFYPGLIGLYIMFSCYVSYTVSASDDTLSTDPFTFNLLGFLAYQGQLSQGNYTNNSFMVNRVYFTVRKNIYKFLSVRVTTDVFQDTTGNMELKLKYVYANFKFDDFAFFTKPYIEAGMIHTPWLDFEEAINTNRMQGTMFMERNKLFASSDIGVAAFTYLGGEMDDNYKKIVSGAYAGRYGSLVLGVYNGSGYNVAEANFNKSIEARLSIRPIPDIIPGLQLSYLGIFGKGNTAQKALTDLVPDWTANMGMISYESEYFNITGEYFTGSGNATGSYASAAKVATKIDGYSVFAMGKMASWRLFARYDSFVPDTDAKTLENNNRVIVGLGYDLGHSNILLLDFDKNYLKSKASPDVNLVKLTMQLNI
ncbi:MAG: hypothetical protein ABSG15_01545 [FCB group bacterium]